MSSAGAPGTSGPSPHTTGCVSLATSCTSRQSRRRSSPATQSAAARQSALCAGRVETEGMRRKALSSRSKRSVSMRKFRDKEAWKEGVERRRGKTAWKDSVERRRERTASRRNAYPAQGSDAVPWPRERYVEAMTLRANPTRLLVHQIASENARDAVRLARSLNGPGAQARGD